MNPNFGLYDFCICSKRMQTIKQISKWCDIPASSKFHEEKWSREWGGGGLGLDMVILAGWCRKALLEEGWEWALCIQGKRPLQAEKRVSASTLKCTRNNQGARRPMWVEQSEAGSSRRLGQRHNRGPACGGPFILSDVSRHWRLWARECYDLTYIFYRIALATYEHGRSRRRGKVRHGDGDQVGGCFWSPVYRAWWLYLALFGGEGKT